MTRNGLNFRKIHKDQKLWIVIVVVHIDLIKLNEIRIKTDF